MDDDAIEAGGYLVHEERLIEISFDVFADRSPEHRDIFGVDELFQHDLGPIFLFPNLFVEKLKHLFDHQFKVILLRFHDLYYLVDIFGAALINLLHDLRYDLHHPGNNFTLIVL